MAAFFVADDAVLYEIRHDYLPGESHVNVRVSLKFSVPADRDHRGGVVADVDLDSLLEAFGTTLLRVTFEEAP